MTSASARSSSKRRRSSTSSRRISRSSSCHAWSPPPCSAPLSSRCCFASKAFRSSLRNDSQSEARPEALHSAACAERRASSTWSSTDANVASPGPRGELFSEPSGVKPAGRPAARSASSSCRWKRSASLVFAASPRRASFRSLCASVSWSCSSRLRFCSSMMMPLHCFASFRSLPHCSFNSCTSSWTFLAASSCMFNSSVLSLAVCASVAAVTSAASAVLRRSNNVTC
mmetsp:Transcript_99772/g.260713  ORF Transcript_99772/g.260713 Transcript_99772/m.260713 type:complete len:228 (-) Transcript_99772:815-1498(-)